MGIKEIILAECDLCTGSIEDGNLYVDATRFGVVFHTGCFAKMTAVQLCSFLALGIGAISVRRLNDTDDVPFIKSVSIMDLFWGEVKEDDS